MNTKHGLASAAALALAVVAFVCVVAAQSSDLLGKIVGVADGDTITVLDASSTQHKIRFNGIDAPEHNQDFGQVSKKHLSDLAFGKDVVVRWSKKDEYSRIIGTALLAKPTPTWSS